MKPPRPRTPQEMTAAQKSAIENSVRSAFEGLTNRQLTDLIMEPYRDLRTKG